MPGERFFAPVRLTLVGTGLRPSYAEADLSEWRAEHEQDERPEVVAAVASFRDGLVVSRRPDDDEASGRCLRVPTKPAGYSDFKPATNPT